MPASMMTKSLSAVRGFTSMTRASSAPAGAAIERPGSTTIGSDVCRTASTSAPT